MELTLPADHPLAKAIMASPPVGLWLVLKTPVEGPYQQYETQFRAGITKWSVERPALAGLSDETVTVELESWEDHIERKAALLGL